MVYELKFEECRKLAVILRAADAPTFRISVVDGHSEGPRRMPSRSRGGTHFL